MDKVDKYITEEYRPNKKAEIRIVLSIPPNIGKTQMDNWVKSKFKHVIKQGGVIEYDIKIV